MKDLDNQMSEIFRQHATELKYRLPTHTKKQILEQFAASKNSYLSWFSGGAGVVAASLALVMAYQFGRISGRPESDAIFEQVVSSHVRSLMVHHLYDVESTDQHTVKPWFEGKIDFSPTVRDFTDKDFPLVGGRLDYVDERTTAALVYKFHQHFINLFQYPVQASEDSAPQLKSIRGFQVFAWSHGGLRYIAVSDVNAADMQRFVELWR